HRRPAFSRPPRGPRRPRLPNDVSQRSLLVASPRTDTEVTAANSELVAGVDTVAVAVRVQDMSIEEYMRIPGRFRLRVRRGWARVEASLPRLANGTNTVAVPVSNVIAATADLLEEIARHVEPMRGATRPENVLVTRLDLVRDFEDVDDIGNALRA